jgi:hypothetical protein
LKEKERVEEKEEKKNALTRERKRTTANGCGSINSKQTGLFSLYFSRARKRRLTKSVCVL